MQTVFRIEHAESGKGMYRNNCGPTILDAYCTDWDGPRHPPPSEDSRLRRAMLEHDVDLNRGDDHYIFGFTSTDQLRAWLFKDEYLEWLEANSFILAICEVEQVLEGNAQCLFIKPDHYMKVSIKEYFNMK